MHSKTNHDPHSIIDSVCDAFEKAFKDNPNVRLEEFVADSPNVNQESLIRELLLLEMELRGITPTNQALEEFGRRFPEYPALVEEVFGSGHQTDSTVALRAQETPGVRAADLAGNALNRLSDYEVLGELGRGGMGVVFRARHLPLNRLVALKTIRSGELAGSEEIQRFQKEAEIAARLEHPGIVRVYETGESDGMLYFSMAFVDGMPLSEKISNGPFDNEDAACVVRSIANALHYAHDKGVIHRDLKPANVLIDAEGEIKITDFGLARIHGSESSMTATGQVLGTPGYMAPEQARGDNDSVDQQTDVYSLGAVLYAVLTGRPPFQATSAVDTLQQVIRDEPARPTTLNHSIDIDLETICLKCLEKEKQQRYDSAADVADELSRYLDGKPIVARPISTLAKARRWSRRNPLVAGLSLALFTGLLLISIGGPIVAFHQARLKESAESLLRTKEELLNEKLGLLGKNEQLIDELRSTNSKLEESISAEREATSRAEKDRRVAEQNQYGAMLSLAHKEYRDSEQHAANILLSQLKEEHRDWGYDRLNWLRDARRIFCDVPGAKICTTDFRPDGKELAVLTLDGKILLIDLVTRTARKEIPLDIDPRVALGEISSWRIRYSPDGNEIYSVNLSGDLCSIDTKTTRQQVVYTAGDNRIIGFEVSRDGHRIAIAARSTADNSIEAVQKTELVVLERQSTNDENQIDRPIGDWAIIFTQSVGVSIPKIVSISPDNKNVLFGATLFDIESQREQWTLEGWSLTSGTLTNDAGLALFGTYNNAGLIVDCKEGIVRKVVRPRKGATHVTASDSIALFGNLKVDLNDKSYFREHQFLGMSHPHQFDSISPDQSLAVIRSSRALELWRLQRIPKLGEFVTPNVGDWNKVCYALSEKGDFLASAADNICFLHDIARGRILQKTEHGDTVSSLCFSPANDAYFVGLANGTVEIVEANTVSELDGQIINSYTDARVLSFEEMCLQEENAPVRASRTLFRFDGTPILMRADASGDRLLICSSKKLSVYDTDNYSVAFSRESESQFIDAVWMNQSVRIAFAEENGEIRLISLDGKNQELLLSRIRQPRALDVSPDDSLLAVGTGNNVQIFRIGEQKPVSFLGSHGMKIMDVSFLPGDRRLLTAGWDGEVRLWDPETGLSLMLVTDRWFTIRKTAISGDRNSLFIIDGGRNAEVLFPGDSLQSAIDHCRTAAREAEKVEDVGETVRQLSNIPTVHRNQYDWAMLGNALARQQRWLEASDAYKRIATLDTWVLCRQLFLSAFLQDWDWHSSLRNKTIEIVPELNDPTKEEALLFGMVLADQYDDVPVSVLDSAKHLLDRVKADDEVQPVLKQLVDRTVALAFFRNGTLNDFYFSDLERSRQLGDSETDLFIRLLLRRREFSIAPSTENAIKMARLVEKMADSIRANGRMFTTAGNKNWWIGPNQIVLMREAVAELKASEFWEPPPPDLQKLLDVPGKSDSQIDRSIAEAATPLVQSTDRFRLWTDPETTRKKQLAEKHAKLADEALKAKQVESANKHLQLIPLEFRKSYHQLLVTDALVSRGELSKAQQSWKSWPGEPSPYALFRELILAAALGDDDWYSQLMSEATNQLKSEDRNLAEKRFLVLGMTAVPISDQATHVLIEEAFKDLVSGWDEFAQGEQYSLLEAAFRTSQFEQRYRRLAKDSEYEKWDPVFLMYQLLQLEREPTPELADEIGKRFAWFCNDQLEKRQQTMSRYWPNAASKSLIMRELLQRLRKNPEWNAIADHLSKELQEAIMMDLDQSLKSIPN